MVQSNIHCWDLGGSIHQDTLKWLVFEGKSYQNGWWLGVAPCLRKPPIADHVEWGLRTARTSKILHAKPSMNSANLCCGCVQSSTVTCTDWWATDQNLCKCGRMSLDSLRGISLFIVLQTVWIEDINHTVKLIVNQLRDRLGSPCHRNESVSSQIRLSKNWTKAKFT